MLQSGDMRYIVFISFVVALLTSCLADLNCDPQEVVKECEGDCKLRICPKHENYDTRCTVTNSCAPSLCDCRFNYKRSINGSCIPSTDCPKFDCNRPNEEYVACPPWCPKDDCNEATPDGRCKRYGLILVVVECEPACRCIPGYWRKDGVCVPYSECPKISDKK